MPGEAKSLCVDDLRHAEYYGMQPVFDELYRKSKSGEIFTNLMEIILRRENILLAYRNIKTNGGSYTAGTDNRNITDIGSRTPKEVVEKGGLLSQGVGTATGPNRLDAKTSRNRTAKQGRSASLASGTG